MPPKKKKGKGKKGSAKKKSAGRQREKPGAPEILPELSKEFYLVQIQDLERRIRRYQEKCDQLELKNRDLEAEAKRMEETRYDMSKLFNKQLEERATRVANLEETGEALDQQLRSEQEEYETQIKNMRETAQVTRDQLKSEITILRSNLESLDDFRLRKEEIEAEMADLRRQLEEKDRQHEEVLYELERKTVQDKNRMKRELEQRLNDVATEFRRVSNKQMAETTKRTLRDNIRYSNQLGEMSGKTEELLQQNETLKKREKEYRLKIGILEENEKELAKKHLSSERMVRMLVDKSEEQQGLLDKYIERDEALPELEAEMGRACKEAELAHLEVEEMKGQLDEREQELEQLKSKLTEVENGSKELIAVLSESATIVQSALKMSSSKSEVPLHETHHAKESLLCSLLDVLNSAAASGIIPGPADLSSDNSQKAKRTGMIRPQQRPLAVSGSPLLPHYHPGDLGIVPKPVQSLGQVRGAKTRTVSVQTVATGKPFVIRADQLKQDILPRTLPTIGPSVSIARRF